MAADAASANPKVLVCDTDALIQIFTARQGELLKRLKRRYGIQPVIPESVEAEITRRGHPKSALILPSVTKALDHGALLVLEERVIGAFTSNDAHSTYTSIQLLGQDNALRIGQGEAYAYAAGVILKAPVLSNDASAVKIADRFGIKLPPFILRAYDLFMLFHQNDELEERDCDNIRQSLLTAGEALPFQVRNKSYGDGLAHIYPRLIDDEYTLIASGKQSELGDLNQLVIKSLRSQSSTTPTQDAAPESLNMPIE